MSKQSLQPEDIPQSVWWRPHRSPTAMLHTLAMAGL